MDKQFDTNQDNWLDDILGNKTPSEEIGPDESAVLSAGLTHPDDLELERIVQETLAENWGEEPAQKTDTDNDNNSTRFFAAPQLEDITPERPKNAERIEDEPVEDSVQEPVVRKLRPKAKKGYGLLGIPHIIATVIWLCLIVAIGSTLGRTLWVCAADLLALGKVGQEVTVTIEENDDMDTIAEKLQKVGMVRYPKLFAKFAELTGKGEGILVGTITFSEDTIYDYNALINAMSYRGGSSVTVQIMIPEGYNCAQIFALLDEKGVCLESELEEYAANGELKGYWFLSDVERGHKYCLEGFLFPDTYEFYLKDEPQRVLEKFLNNFEYRFSSRMVDKFVALNNQLGGAKLTLKQLVTMASIIEKEKANTLEGYTISSVFYNRLKNAASFPFLNSDATIKYDTEYYSKGQLVTDAQINASPYNTYTQRGLPPGPIANPGLASLDAALEPEDTGYFYFIFDKNAGVHRFSKTLAEHEQKGRELGY